MKNNLTAEEVLADLAVRLPAYLEELKEAAWENERFAYGVKTAYVECLEIVQLWKDSARYGLDFPIEKRFPL